MQSGAFRTLEEEAAIGGVVRTFLSTKGPHRDEEQQVIGLIGISRDMSERKQQEKARLHEMGLHLGLGELLQACRTLDEAYRVIGRLAPHFFPEESGAVYLFHSSRDHLEAQVTWGDGAGAMARTFAPDD